MPKLQRLGVEFYEAGFNYDRYEFYFCFAAGGIETWTDLDENDLHRNRLIWHIPRGSWHVGSDLEAYWNQVIGQDGIVKYEKL
jgi:hypothetical protein